MSTSEQFWNSLTKEQQVDAFCAVVSRLYKGEVNQLADGKRILFRIFEFEPQHYNRAVEANFFALHNHIFGNDEQLLAMARNLQEHSGMVVMHPGVRP